jgi:hypothetical protein
MLTCVKVQTAEAGALAFELQTRDILGYFRFFSPSTKNTYSGKSRVQTPYIRP